MMYEMSDKDMATLVELKTAIKESSKTTKVYVGCDSKRKRKVVRYATVVILHINGKNGGRMFSFIAKETDYSKVTNPRLRLVTEAHRAVDIAYEIAELVGDREFQIHLDLNTSPKHKSYEAVKESLGYVLGMMGFDAKLKPEAFAASTAADKLVNN